MKGDQMGGNNMENPDTKVSGNNGTEGCSANEDNMFTRLENKIKEDAGVITEYLGKNWRNIGSATAISLLLTGMAYSSACTNQDSSPTPAAMAFEQDAVPLGGSQQEETMVKPTPTVIVEPTPTETPPEVDLTWSWEDVAAIFERTPESLSAQLDGSAKKSRYWIFNEIKLYNPERTYPASEEGLIEFDTIRKLNDSFQLGLDAKGEEILKQAFLYQLDPNKPREEQKIDVYAYVKNGCVYLKSGAVAIIKEADNEKGFDVRIYKQENIPWDEIPSEYWGNIDKGDTLIDMSGDEIVCSCNVNDIRSSSNSAEE